VLDCDCGECAAVLAPDADGWEYAIVCAQEVDASDADRAFDGKLARLHFTWVVDRSFPDVERTERTSAEGPLRVGSKAVEPCDTAVRVRQRFRRASGS
jgi:hypothetical protein